MNNSFGWRTGETIWNASFLNGYNTSIFLGIILAMGTSAYFWRRQKYSWENFQIIILLVVPFSLFGARLYTVIFDGGWDRFFEFRGLSIYGGVIGALIPISIYLWFRRYTIDYRTAFSMIMPTILIGQACGRWGNFQNHEVYGLIVSSESLDWMGPLKSHMLIDGHYRAPIFFYESMSSLFGYFVLCWVLNDRNWLKPGVVGMLYVLYYGVVRIVLQTQRDPSPTNTSYIGNTGISLNLVVSSLLITVSVIFALWWQFIGKLVNKKYPKFPYKEYELIKPSKEVKRFWVGKKYERTFRIWIPVREEEQKWSKLEINKGQKKKRA